MKKKNIIKKEKTGKVEDEPCYLCPCKTECIGKGFCVNMGYDYTKGSRPTP